MKILGLLLFSIILGSGASGERNFATFVPQQKHTIQEDTAKQKSKTVVIIKKIDEKGNEKETVHEFWGNSTPDSLTDRILQRFAFEFPHRSFDSAMDELRFKVETFIHPFGSDDTNWKEKMNEELVMRFPFHEGNIENLEKLRHFVGPDSLMKLSEERIIRHFPLSEMEIEKMGDRVVVFKETRPFPHHKNVEIIDLDKEELKEYQLGNNSLQLNRFAYYPNPNRGHVNVEFSTKSKKPIRLRVYDLTGKVWYEESLGDFEGNYQKALPVTLSRGIFILKIEQDGKAISKKIVVE